jgi:hypothetical protein
MDGEAHSENTKKKKNFTRCVFQMTFNAQNSEKSLNSSLSLRLTNNNNKKCRKNSFCCLLPNVFPSPSPWDSFCWHFCSTVR